MGKVSVLMLRAPGTNCDAETAFAFQQAGAIVSSVHINQLIRHEERMADYQIMVIPGGFTYGDDIAAGRVLANELKVKLAEDILKFIQDGRLILGICSGFQVLVKAGFLPEPRPRLPQRLTFSTNDSGRFECRWVYLKANRECSCVFTEGIDMMYLPVAHGEGKIIADAEALPQLKVALYYADKDGNTSVGYPGNPNGSVDNIAGLCDASGRVFALMPHPERHLRGSQHPQWSRLGTREHGDGFQLFRNAVAWAERL